MSYSPTVTLHAVLILASCCLVPVNKNSVLSSVIIKLWGRWFFTQRSVERIEKTGRNDIGLLNLSQILQTLFEQIYNFYHALVF